MEKVKTVHTILFLFMLVVTIVCAVNTITDNTKGSARRNTTNKVVNEICWEIKKDNMRMDSVGYYNLSNEDKARYDRNIDITLIVVNVLMKHLDD